MTQTQEFDWPDSLKQRLLLGQASSEDAFAALPAILEVHPDTAVEAFLRLDQVGRKFEQAGGRADRAAYQAVAKVVTAGMLKSTVYADLCAVADGKKAPDAQIWDNVQTELTSYRGAQWGQVYARFANPIINDWRDRQQARQQQSANNQAQPQAATQSQPAASQQQAADLAQWEEQVAGPAEFLHGWPTDWGRRFLNWATANEWRGAVAFYMIAPTFKDNPTWAMVRVIKERFLTKGAPEWAWLNDSFLNDIDEAIRANGGALAGSNEVLVDDLADFRDTKPPTDLFDAALENVQYYLQTEGYPAFRAALIAEARGS